MLTKRCHYDCEVTGSFILSSLYSYIKIWNSANALWCNQRYFLTILDHFSTVQIRELHRRQYQAQIISLLHKLQSFLFYNHAYVLRRKLKEEMETNTAETDKSSFYVTEVLQLKVFNRPSFPNSDYKGLQDSFDMSSFCRWNFTVAKNDGY